MSENSEVCGGSPGSANRLGCRYTALELDREIVGPLSPSDDDTLPVIRLHRRKRPG